MPATYHHGVFRRLASCARWARSSSSSATFSVSPLITTRSLQVLSILESTFPGRDVQTAGTGARTCSAVVLDLPGPVTADQLIDEVTVFAAGHQVSVWVV